MSVPLVSIIIVSWNALTVLQRCLPSVLRSTWPRLQFVFVDNASTDGSADWVSAQLPDIKIIRNSTNWRFCRANNEAIRQTSGDYVVLLNNDVAVGSEWLEPLVALAEDNERIAAVQPKIMQLDAPDTFEYAGAAGGYLDRLGYPFARGRIFGHLEKDVEQYDNVARLDWASGAAVLLRRSALQEVGLLDETFEMHMEEIDLCWRLRRAGYEIVVAPNSKVFHIGGASLPQKSVQKLYFNVRNNLLMLYKNLSPAQWRRLLIERVFIDHSIAFAWLLSGRFRKAWTVVRAYRDAHRRRKRYVQPKSSQVQPSYRGRILFDYVLRGHRRFTDLSRPRFTASDS